MDPEGNLLRLGCWVPAPGVCSLGTPTSPQLQDSDKDRLLYIVFTWERGFFLIFGGWGRWYRGSVCWGGKGKRAVVEGEGALCVEGEGAAWEWGLSGV